MQRDLRLASHQQAAIVHLSLRVRGWHVYCICSPTVRVAIPIWQERVSPVLDVASRLLVVTCRAGKPVQRKEFLLSQLSPEVLAESVAELGVDVLLCAALSDSLFRSLERRGVRVRPHLCGDVEPLLRAFIQGGVRRSEFRMPGCWGWHLNGACARRAPAIENADATALLASAGHKPAKPRPQRVAPGGDHK